MEELLELLVLTLLQVRVRLRLLPGSSPQRGGQPTPTRQRGSAAQREGLRWTSQDGEQSLRLDRVGSQTKGGAAQVTFFEQVSTDLLTRGGKDIAFSDYCPLWRFHRRLVHSAFSLFGEGTSRLQDMGEFQPLPLFL